MQWREESETVVCAIAKMKVFQLWALALVLVGIKSAGMLVLDDVYLDTTISDFSE